jgi:hypothetical protein
LKIQSLLSGIRDFETINDEHPAIFFCSISSFSAHNGEVLLMPDSKLQTMDFRIRLCSGGMRNVLSEMWNTIN